MDAEQVALLYKSKISSPDGCRIFAKHYIEFAATMPAKKAEEKAFRELKYAGYVERKGVWSKAS